MLIIDVITTRPFSKLRLWIPIQESYRKGDCNTARKRRSSTAIWRFRE